MRYCLNVKAATLVYKNMILPILEYGDVFMSAATKVNRNRLQTLQNKALRIANNSDRGCDKDMLHEQSKLLKLKPRRNLHLLQYMYTRRNDPSIKKPKSNYRVQTRASSKNNFWLPKPSTEKYKQCASYMGPKMWNMLPARVQDSANSSIFKAKVLSKAKAKAKTNAKDKGTAT